jgi:hypothetical protein
MQRSNGRQTLPAFSNACNRRISIDPFGGWPTAEDEQLPVLAGEIGANERRCDEWAEQTAAQGALRM